MMPMRSGRGESIGGRSGLRRNVLGHFEERVHEFDGGLGFDGVGARPCFVSTEGEVAWGWHVAVVAVRELDHERVTEWASFAELDPGFGEGFARGRADADVTDTEHLDGELGLWTGLCEALDPACVHGGDIGFGVGFRLRFGFCGPLQEVGFHGSPCDGKFAVFCVERCGGGPLEGGEACVDFGRDVVRDVSHLLVGFFAGARGPEVDVVDIAAGAVGHECHERCVGIGVGLEAFKFLAVHAEVVGGDIAVRNAADVVQRVRGKHGDEAS